MDKNFCAAIILLENIILEDLILNLIVASWKVNKYSRKKEIEGL